MIILFYGNKQIKVIMKFKSNYDKTIIKLRSVVLISKQKNFIQIRKMHKFFLFFSIVITIDIAFCLKKSTKYRSGGTAFLSVPLKSIPVYNVWQSDKDENS